MLGRRSGDSSSVVVLDGYAEGYLVKQGGRIKTWHKRYFVFQNGSLSYRKDSRASSKVLRRDTIVDVHYFDKVRNGLCVLLGSGRVLSLSAKTEDQANAWYDVFSEYVCHRRKMKELNQLQKRQNEHLERITECDDSASTCMDDDCAVLSDTDSDSEFWLFEF